MQYLVSAITDRFTHPILASVLMSAVAFFLIGGVLELVQIPGVPPLAAAFFGIYCVLASVLGLFGYGVLYLARLVSIAGDKSAAHNT